MRRKRKLLGNNNIEMKYRKKHLSKNEISIFNIFAHQVESFFLENLVYFRFIHQIIHIVFDPYSETKRVKDILK